MLSPLSACPQAIDGIFAAELLTLSTMRTYYGGGDLEIHTIDVGQGASELVIGPNGTSILIDGGTSSKGFSEVLPYLNAIFPPGSRHLDYMIASHDDRDHYGGLNSVLSGGYTAGTIYHCGINSSFGKGIQIPLGLEIDLGDGAKVTCVGRYGQFIGGSSGNTSDNNASVCLLIQYCGSYGSYGGFDYITAGDLEGNEDQLSNALITYPPGSPYLDPAYGVDVIHVNHHGSDGSSSANYVNRLKPGLAVINGGTNYGHPRWKAVDRLKGRTVYSDGSGATGVTWSGASQVYRTTYDIVEDGRAPEWDCPTLGDMVLAYDGCSYNYYLNGNPFPVDQQPICITPSPTPPGYHTPTPPPTPPPTPSPTSTVTPTPSTTPTPENYKTPSPTPSTTPTPTTTPPPPPSPTPPPAVLPFYDGFETGGLSQYWTIFTDAEGRVQVDTSYPYAGAYSALLDDSYSGGLYSTVALTLTVDLSQQSDSDVDLGFWWREFSDENHPGDGVFISDDYGGSWSRIFSFNNGPQSYTQELISLSAMRSAYGLEFNDHFQVKFQFYDNFEMPTDGYALDEVRIALTPTATPTPSPTATPTTTPTPPPTTVPTTPPTPPPTATATPSVTPTPFATPTPPPTATPIPTPSTTSSPTPTPSLTPMATATPTATPSVAPSLTPTAIPTPQSLITIIDSGDYNGDGTSDIAIFRGSSGMWSVREVTRVYYGSSSDIPIPGDYNGDGATDIGIFRPGSGLWGVRGVTRVYYGSASDIPIPGDYNGDGSCDIGIFRSSSGLWAVTGVTRAYFGGPGDIPVPGDYEGDGANDIALFRMSSGMWAVRDLSRVYYGSSRDAVVPRDYNGDGTWEVGIFRPSSGMWAVRGLTRAYYGSASDWPVPADYNGDLADEIGIFRPSSGLWAVRDISRAYFGTSGDLPVTR